MQLSNPSFKFGSTAVLAYPDTTRLAGYRSALALLKALSVKHGTNSNDQCKCSISAKPAELVLQPSDSSNVCKIQEEISLMLVTPTAKPDLTFCFINGLPAQEKIPELVDSIIDMLETNGVKRIVSPAAADLTGIKNGDRLWIRSIGSNATDGDKGKQQVATEHASELPDGANTNDVFLSALDTILCVSGIAEAALLIHGDKRPAGSGYRQKVVFGSEYVDKDDISIVDNLKQALSAALRIGKAGEIQNEAVEVVRVQLDAESSSKELYPAFG
ncbi:hypothetical protein BX070DRAFT_220320 [Coemansia spiralis]|nr:hypothetical protein BX070DRAFT_220320 [Coemansia spiralis]